MVKTYNYIGFALVCVPHGRWIYVFEQVNFSLSLLQRYEQSKIHSSPILYMCHNVPLARSLLLCMRPLVMHAITHRAHIWGVENGIFLSSFHLASIAFICRVQLAVGKRERHEISEEEKKASRKLSSVAQDTQHYKRARRASVTLALSSSVQLKWQMKHWKGIDIDSDAKTLSNAPARPNAKI